MLTPQQITALRDRAGQVTDPIVEYLIADIAERVSEAGQLTSTAAYQAWTAQKFGVSQKELKKELKKRLNFTTAEINQLFEQAAHTGYANDIQRLGETEAVSFEENTSLQQILDSSVKLANAEFENITQTMGFVGPDGQFEELTKAYQRTCDFAFEKVVNGAQDYNSAVRDAIKGLAKHGIRVMDYDSGVHTSIEAAVRRNIMGGLGLMNEQIAQQNHDDLGCDGWEISAHGGCAPDHEPIQGKRYSDKEYERLNNSLVRRIGTLFCGHSGMPIILGVNAPQYTKAELEEFRQQNEEGITYEGKHYTLYEAMQRQSRLETSIRNRKHRILIDEKLGDKDTLQTDQIRLQILKQEYSRFSKAAHLPMQYARMEAAGFDWRKGKAAEQSGKQVISYFKSRDFQETGSDISQPNVTKLSIEDINKRGTKNLITAYERRRTHFGLNMASGEDVLSNQFNTFVEDYTGVSVDTANAFETTIAKLSEKYYTGLTRVEVGDPKKFFGSNVYASVTPMPTVGANTLTLNPLKTKDYSALVRRVRELSRKGYCVKVPEAQLGEYIATHEFAHTLINMKVDSYKNYVGIDVNYFRKARKEIESLYGEYILDIRNLENRRKVIEERFFTASNQSELSKIRQEYSLVKAELESKKISKYSLENSDEFMAEGFTDCMIGENPSDYSKKILEVLNRYFGR